MIFSGQTRQRGASLPELVMVLTMVGVLSAYTVPKALPEAGKSTAGYQAAKLADNLRHTRMLAMGWGKALTFISDSNSYRVVCSSAAECNGMTATAVNCPNPTTVVASPGQSGPFCIALEGGVTLSAPAALAFDTLGRPVASASTDYRLYVGPTLMATVSVAATTGYVSSVVVR